MDLSFIYNGSHKQVLTYPAWYVPTSCVPTECPWQQLEQKKDTLQTERKDLEFGYSV